MVASGQDASPLTRTTMPTPRPPDVTELLADVVRGEAGAADRLFPAVYDELRELARRLFRRQQPDHTLQPTALVHEAYLRLVDQSRDAVEGRTHFFNVAALAMRQILADHARRRRAAKRGGEWARVSLGHVKAGGTRVEIDLIALDDALTRLARLDERQARIVELRFLAGLTTKETASVIGVSRRTVELDWRMARAWLRLQLSEGESR